MRFIYFDLALTGLLTISEMDRECAKKERNQPKRLQMIAGFSLAKNRLNRLMYLSTDLFREDTKTVKKKTLFLIG